MSDGSNSTVATGIQRDVTAVMQVIAESLRSDVDVLALELVGLILAHEAGYARGRGSVSEADLLASCRANLDRVLQMLADSVPEGEDPLDASRATGRRRAEQFLPLGVLLHSYRLGGQLVWRGLVRQARSAPQPVGSDELVEIATSVWDVVDRGAMACTEAYRGTEWELLARDENRRAAVLHSLLEGQQPAGAAEALSVPAHGRYLVAVVALGPDSEPRCAPGPELRRGGMPSSWHVYRGTQVGLVALGPGRGEPGSRRVLEALLPGPAGLSPAVNGLAEVAHAYRLALLARRSLPRESDDVAWLDDRLPEAMVAGSPELALRLRSRLLGPLATRVGPERDVLLETLRAWDALGGSPSRVAEALYCHRNTVLKRIHRVEQLTGTRLSDVRDAAGWHLALFAAELLDG